MNNIFEILQYVAIAILAVYYLVTGMMLLMGKNAMITGWTYMTEEDKAYYDEKKVKSTAAICNLVAGVCLVLMVVVQMMGNLPLMLVPMLGFIAGAIAPNYLIKKTGYFIKK
ncbi:MAG: DUF3784 domain-containing protein [Lachnospiraceae bacterium]|nr:DUF3784 domain-containing protein [Lachnospiraceae bacterium]